ncbi:unnamed protein product, partial [Ectocarpus fasciculatus]
RGPRGPTRDEKEGMRGASPICPRICALQPDVIALGQGFGVGKWNGFGGKVEAGESFEQGAARELMEESSLRATDLAKRGYLVFRMEEACKYMKVHVYETWRAEGEPVESDEMRPQWYAETDLPFSRMWPDDEHWLPLFLSSNKMIVGRFDYSDSDTIVDFSVKQM